MADTAQVSDGDMGKALGQLFELLNVSDADRKAMETDPELMARMTKDMLTQIENREPSTAAAAGSGGGAGGGAAGATAHRGRSRRRGEEDDDGEDDRSRGSSVGSRSTGSRSSGASYSTGSSRGSGSRSPSPGGSRSRSPDSQASYSSGGGSSASYDSRDDSANHRRRSDGHSYNSPASGTASTPSRRPRPIDLWKAAHETQGGPKEPVTLNAEQWDDLVDRLNDSSRQKHVYLMKAQHRAIASELRDLKFSPQICKRSRDIAATVEQLPLRIGKLVKIQKANQDKLRHELARAEFADVTFQPKINSRSKAMSRSVANLTRYGEVRRIRRKQRARIIQEVEDRELTFSPQINKQSLRLLAAKRAREKVTDEEAQRLREEKLAKKRLAAMRSQARNPVPGHEEENFAPLIDKRSRAMVRNDSRSVFERLYQTGSEKTAARRVREETILAAHSPTVRRPNQRTRSNPAGSGGNGGPSSPDARAFVNTVVYKPETMSFVARHVNMVTASSEAAASALLGM